VHCWVLGHTLAVTFLSRLYKWSQSQFRLLSLSTTFWFDLNSSKNNNTVQWCGCQRCSDTLIITLIHKSKEDKKRIKM
jgi:hypothetical protein